ncbi:MAG: AAA family ATPase, partial [Chlorobi bacterium]|nr:AAA family ATPase [Chlorobiota bacterium]
IKPDPTLLKDKKINGVNLEKLLKSINQRIELLYDRDHTIGHAYFFEFLNNEENKNNLYEALCSVFCNKIIPLLQEYFYDDAEKIQLVLGDHKSQLKENGEGLRLIVNKQMKSKDILGTKEFTDIEYDSIRVNNELITGKISAEAFIKIYKFNKDIPE